jgi:hypothetical protein
VLSLFFGFCNLREQTEKGNHPPHPFCLHHLCSAMADKVTIILPHDPWPFSTITVEDLETLVADGLLRPLSDGLQPEWMAPSSEADPTPPSGMCSVSSPSTSGGLECQRAASCGRSCTTMEWSCITSTPTISRKRPSSRRFVRVFWGLTLTEICGPISFLRSSSPR